MISAGGKLARDSLWMILVQIFGRGMALLFSLYIAGALGVQQFGAYGYIMAIITMAGVAADFGSNTYQVRQTAILSDIDSRRAILSSSLIIRIVLGILGLAIVTAIALLLSDDAGGAWLIILFGAGMFFNNINGAFINSLIGHERFGLYGIIFMISQVFNVGSACLLVYLGYGLYGIGFAFSGWSLVSLIANSLVISVMLYRPSLGITRADVYSFFREAAPIGLTAVLVVIYYKSDYLILEYYRGKAEVGFYNAAYVIINALIFLPSTISSTLLPKMSYFLEKNMAKLELIYRASFKYLFFAGFGLGFGGIGVSYQLIRRIYPQEYEPAYAALNILIWVLALIFVNSMQGNMIIAIGKQRLMPWITGAACLANIIMNFILIPRYGMEGAAAATVLAELVAGAGCFYILRRSNRLKDAIPVVLRSFAAGGIMYLFLITFPGWSLFIRIPAGIIIYFAVLIILKGLTRVDMQPIMEILKND